MAARSVKPRNHKSGEAPSAEAACSEPQSAGDGAPLGAGRMTDSRAEAAGKLDSQSPIRQSSWSGSETARREQGFCRAPVHAPVAEVFVVPAGTAAWVRRVTEVRWARHATRREITFLRAEFVDKGCLIIRVDGWQLRVAQNLVLRRKEQVAK
jgi:hypothetical protein